MSGIFDQVINYAPPSLLTGTVTYEGTWSAATNTPTLPNPPSSVTNGHYYVVSAGGTQFSLVFNIGDWIISNGSAWEKVDNTDAVDSVFGRTGAVVGVSTDYSAVGITNTALGASNPSTVAATTITASSTIAATGAVTGSNLSGTNTGDQTITLTGGVTGSGTGSFAATVVTNANLTGDVTSSGNATTLTNAPVIAKVLTGYTSGAGTVAATDSILQAIQKLNGNDATNANLTGVITSVGNATSIASQTGTGTKFVVDTSPQLVTPNIGVATGTSLAAALNGTLGATTPSSIAATTGTFSSTLGVTGVATLGNGAILGTPASGTVTNLTGTASININGTVGATTPSTIAATTISASGLITSTGDAQFGSASKMLYLRTLSGINRIDSYDNPITATVPLQINASTYTFQVADVTRGTLTSTGLNSIAIGATTPSTGAFSTLSATGTITASGGVLIGNGIATGLYGDTSNLAVRGYSTGSVFIQNATGSSTFGQFSSGGLAVTGGLTTTTDISAAVYGYFGSSGVAPSASNPGFAFSNPLNVSAANWSAGVATTSLTLVNVYNGNGVVGTVVTNGSATAWNTSSDARLKTNLRDITDSSVIIDALKPRRFDWLTFTKEKDDYGFVAQEAYEVYPKMVTVGGDDPAEKPWGIDASKLIPVLVAELQSLRKRLAALEAK